jgi:DnaK suppressor protein
MRLCNTPTERACLTKKKCTNRLVEVILPSMTDLELGKSQCVLKALKARMERLVPNRDGIAVERSPDPTDEAQFACDRELTVRALDRESRMAAAINSALKRVEDGTYGVCERCDESIGAKRLAAVPWAACCIRCQKELDHQAGQLEDAASFQGHRSAA